MSEIYWFWTIHCHQHTSDNWIKYTV